jgi:tRNA(Ile)-lysidine synthase
VRKNQKQSLLERTNAFIQEHHIDASKKTLLVAVSGGPDSICLLHILNKLKPEFGLKLHVVHLDHKLRGKSSTADAQYVLDFCHELGIPVTIEQRDVRSYQKEHKISLEEAARDVRYSFFAEVAESLGAKWIAVGHTRDDHIETILLNLLRGTGTRGLRGLQPVRKWRSENNQLTIIRPLLEVSREETADYCRRHQLQPRIDTTNNSLKLTRNRVRLKLLPLLKTYNPDVIEALLRTARIAGDDITFLENTARRYAQKLADKHEHIVYVEKRQLLKLPVSLQRLVFRQLIEDIIGTLKDIESRHIEEMIEFLNKPAGKKISLPYGLYFASGYDRFVLGSDIEGSSPFSEFMGEHTFKIPGSLNIGRWKINTNLVELPSNISDDKYTAYLDADLIKGELWVRTRRSGDRFQPLGMKEEKKVGQFMIDARIPQGWRDRIPIVCTPDNVIWIVGYRIDDRYKITEVTKSVLRIRFETRMD